MRVLHYANLACLSQAAAALLADAARDSVARRRQFILALSGGSTPRLLYRILAASPYRETVPWGGVQLFWTDERCVPPTHPMSNYRLARETLLSRLPIAAEQVHRLPGEIRPPERAAREFEREMRRFFPRTRRRRGFPVFDLVLLGVGPDGHTASLFAGRPALEEQRRWVVAESRPGHPPFAARLTLTLPVLNAARQVVFLVAGPQKQAVVEHPQNYPAGRVQAERILWLVTP